MSKNIGIVEWFNDKRGFGVIKYNNQEIFAHHSEIITDSENFKVLYQNEEVEFDLITDNKGRLNASNIRGSNGSKLQFEINNNNINNKNKNINNRNKKKFKNTESFEPSFKPPDMRVVIGNSSDLQLNKTLQGNDVMIVPNLFNDENIYDNLLKEIEESGVDLNELWKVWHGDSHLIADDHIDWKTKCPQFNNIINKINTYFEIDIKATRFNLYKNSDHWKPYHHDAAAVKPHIAKKQNLTVGISFGAEREISFEHAKTKTIVSFPLENGSVYAFGKDINIIWKHGIPQLPPENYSDKGRISIIAWGKAKQIEIY